MNSMRVNAASPVYCILGNPVGHSLSPLMHNRALAAANLPGVYVGFQVADPAAAVNAIRALGIRGASVTIPHKVAVMAHLDRIDETARAIGAVNTILNRDGILTGVNTDGHGALVALLGVTEVAGKRVALIGAGGAARAVAWTVSQAGGNVVIYNRTPERAAALAHDLGLAHQPLADLGAGRFEILINTTSVGMAPLTDAMPVDPAGLDPNTVVMDVVYNPLETAMLAAARRRGCPTVDGAAMFVAQGARQFELWTGVAAPATVMHRAVVEALSLPRFVEPGGTTRLKEAP